MSDFMSIVVLALIAGLLSSIIGGLIVIFMAKPTKSFIGLTFIFASAVLITLVFVDFLPHAIGHGHYHTNIAADGTIYRYWHQHSGAGIWLTIVGVLIGVALVYSLNFFDKFGHEHVHGVLPHNEECSHDAAEKNETLTWKEKRRILKAAIPIAAAIIIHDIPKGLAIGSSGTILAAILIGISCIPEGMSIAIPLKSGGMKPGKILGLCALAGTAIVVGAIIGYFIGGFNVYLSGMMFAIAAGCILAVVFSEILPLAMEYTEKSKLKLVVMIAGVILVFTLNYFFHDLMH